MAASATGSTSKMRLTKKHKETLSVHHPNTMLTEPTKRPEIQNLSPKNFQKIFKKLFFFFLVGQ